MNSTTSVETTAIFRHLLAYHRLMHIQYLLFRSKAFKQGDRLSDSQGFILMAFVNDVVGDDVREGVGEDKEHM